MDCLKHSGAAGKAGARNRALLDPKIEPLPNSQTGAGTHKCAYCAYELGYQDGLEAAIGNLKGMLSAEPKPERPTPDQILDEIDMEDLDE